MKWNGWTIAIITYSSLLIVTALPILLSFVKKRNRSMSDLYNKISHLSDQEKLRLNENLELLYPFIVTWSHLQQVYRRFQFYSLGWTILASVLIPILAQAIDGTSEAKWFLTLVSVHASVLLAFNKGLSVDDKVRLYRDGENDFNDLNRALRANPLQLGSTSEAMITEYLKELNIIVNTIRVGEDKPVFMPEPAAVTVSTVATK